MAKPAARLAFLQVLLALGVVVTVGRAFMVQVVQYPLWRKRAEARDMRVVPIPARRGSIYDRNGVPLAVTQETYHVKVARNELSDEPATRGLLQRALSLPAADLDRQFRGPYPYFGGPYGAIEVEPLRGVKGITFDVLRGRAYPLGRVALPLLGHVDRESGRGVQGLEGAFDTLLAGTPGAETVFVDGRGQWVRPPGAVTTPPVPGRDVYLTLDNDLQGIAEETLRRTVTAARAQGGDVVVLEIATGEILAIASLRTDPQGRMAPQASALVEPYEPGSTAKIFTAAALLRSGSDTMPVSGEGGRWVQVDAGNRVIEDVHAVSGMLSVLETIKFSSNIAISKFALGIPPDSHFVVMRDFGFGLPPATGFPGEENGQLTLPAASANMRFTQPSWGQGYEVMTTALQVANAYASIANHGVLMAPTLLRETRDGTLGHVAWRHRPDTVRRVLDEAVAQTLMGYLRAAADTGGTGRRAQLDRYQVVGKTGTAKVPIGGNYNTGLYRASFAGIFPGSAPSIVVYVMIDRPSGAYYGGQVAAPLVRSLLQQALALPSSPLDASRLTATMSRPIPPAMVPVQARSSHLATWPAARDTTRPRPVVSIPDVVGLGLREGLHQLHSRGLTIKLFGQGRIVRTTPSAGDAVTPGTVVTVHAESRQ